MSITPNIVLHQRILARIEQMRAASAALGAPANILEALANIELKLNLATINALARDDTDRTEYLRVLRTEGSINALAAVAASLRSIASEKSRAFVMASPAPKSASKKGGNCTISSSSLSKSALADAAKLMKLADSLTVADLAPPHELRDDRHCKCGGNYSVIQDTGEVQCDQCTRIKQSGIKPNKNRDNLMQHPSNISQLNYDKHRRHYYKWISYIQALDNTSFSQDHIASIKAYLARYGHEASILTCDFMREKLVALGLTRYNNSVPSLIKTLGGPTPPILTSEEHDYVDMRFSRIIELYIEAFPEQSNILYYPYFIYKILDDMFPKGHPKRRLLLFIHLQSHETVIENDKFFKRICQIAEPDDELTYVPTRRVVQL